MTSAADPGGAAGLRQVLRDDYEVLRNEVLEGREQGLGLALLLREGMAAWMRAVASTAPNPEASPRPRGCEALPLGGVRGEVVSVLASMALAIDRSALS